MSNAFLPYLRWDVNSRVVIRSLAELNRILDQISSEAAVDMPVTVELFVNSETGLSATFGREESHVEFYSATNKPPVVGCSGPWSDDVLISFLHQGEYTEIERRYCVPAADARKALEQYFQTGDRPTNIRWNDGFVQTT